MQTCLSNSINVRPSIYIIVYVIVFIKPLNIFLKYNNRNSHCYETKHEFHTEFSNEFTVNTKLYILKDILP